MNKGSKTTGAVVTEMIEAMGSRSGRYVRLAEIARTAGLSAEEIARGVQELMDTCDDFRATARNPSGGESPKRTGRWPR